jgi:hypothetical protein
MPDEGVGAAVLESPDVSQQDNFQDESNQSTVDAVDGKPAKDEAQPDKQDGRKQPDALRKRVAELRRQADSITDPVAKQALLNDAKALNDTIGKSRAYEELFPTVREVREVKALLDSVGGRDGFTQMQARASQVAEIDQKLAAGDASVIENLWKEAPEGMPKLVPAIADKFAAEKPQEYTKFIAPRAIAHLDQSGFPQAFDRLVQLYETGKVEEAKALKQEMIAWVTGQRNSKEQTKQVDPEVERLRAELAEKNRGEDSKAIDTAYNAVITHAGPVIDKVLKPLVAKLGLSAEQYQGLREDVWQHLQDQRNANATYKTIAPAKQKAGYDQWTQYAQRWTDDNALDAARARVQFWYGHQLKNGAQATKVDATATPGVKAVQQGKEPLPSEIDYGPKGIQAAKKAGFKDIQDMILSGQAPLKVGGIRKWR